MLTAVDFDEPDVGALADTLIDNAIEDGEIARQLRIAAGEELQCVCCGCSETQACPGGCVWATPTLCSRCV